MLKKGSYKIGLIIMALGILMLLGFLGMNIGWIIGLIIPTYFVYKGWQLFTQRQSTGKKVFGIFLMIIGLLWLAGMLHVIIGLAIAALLIYYGMKMIKKNKSLSIAPDLEAAIGEGFKANPTMNEFSFKDYDHLDEWEKEINKHKK